MANIKSAKRSIRTDRRRNELNRWKRARLRTSNKKILGFIKAGETEKASAEFKVYSSLIDKAVKTHLVTRGLASRKKSRLAGQINKISAKG